MDFYIISYFMQESYEKKYFPFEFHRKITALNIISMSKY